MHRRIIGIHHDDERFSVGSVMEMFEKCRCNVHHRRPAAWSGLELFGVNQLRIGTKNTLGENMNSCGVGR